MTNLTIMEAFYWYEYTKSNHKTVPYLRQLCKEVTKDKGYGVGQIVAKRIPVKVGKRYKQFWAWGYPDPTEAKAVLMEDDAKSGGIVRAQTDKAGNLGRPTETKITQKAPIEAKESEEAKPKTEESEEAEKEAEDESDEKKDKDC